MCQENVGFEAILVLVFSQFCSLCYIKGLRISSAGCGMRKTDQDVSNRSVLKSIVSTRYCSSLVKIYISRIFWDQFLCDVVARKKQITTKCKYLY